MLKNNKGNKNNNPKNLKNVDVESCLPCTKSITTKIDLTKETIKCSRNQAQCTKNTTTNEEIFDNTVSNNNKFNIKAQSNFTESTKGPITSFLKDMAANNTKQSANTKSNSSASSNLTNTNDSSATSDEQEKGNVSILLLLLLLLHQLTNYE